MFKKSTAIFLSWLMLLVFCQGMAVFAVLPETAETNGARWTDDFNRFTSSDTISSAGYPRESYGQSSDVFVPKAGFYASFIDNGGRDGSTAMRLEQNQAGNNINLATKQLNMTDGTYDAFVFSHEFNILQNPEIVTTFYLGSRSDWSGRQFTLAQDAEGHFILKNAQGTQTYAYSLNTWYKLVVMQTANTRFGWLLDAESGEVLMTNQTVTAAKATEDAAVLVGSIASTYTQTMQVMVDGAELYAYKMASYPPTVTKQSLAEGAAEVAASGSAEVSFDQPIAEGCSACVYPTADQENRTTCTVTAVTGKMNTYRIAWKGLAGDTAYTLDMTGFCNQGGAASTSIIHFTTEESGIEVLEDSFSDATRFNRDGYDTDKAPSGWFGTGQYATASGNISQNTTDGYSADGTANAAMQLKRLGAGGYSIKSLSALPLAADETLIETYRINIKNKGTITAAENESGETVYTGDLNMGLGVVNGSKTHMNSSDTIAFISIHPGTGRAMVNGSGYGLTESCELQENHWYNLIVSVRRTEHTLFVIDAANGELIWKNTLYTDGETENKGNNLKTIAPFTNGVQIYQAVVVGGAAASTQEVLLDDVSLWRVKPEQQKHKLALVASDENAVIGTNGSVCLRFNQPIVSDSTAVMLYRGTEKNEKAEPVITVTYPDFCTQRISFTNLYHANDYTLDYSGMKAVSGADLGAAMVSSVLHFATEAGTSQLEIVSDIACEGLTQGGKLTFDVYSRTGDTQKLAAAVYKKGEAGQLLGVEMLNVNLTSGRQKVTLPLTGSYASAGQVKIFAWGSALNPLMKEGSLTV